MGLLSCRVRRVVYITIIIVILYGVVQFLRPDEYLVTDRASQRERIARMIQSERNNNNVRKGEQACVHPRLEVDSPEMMKFVKYQGPLDCGSEEDWVNVEGSTASIKSSARHKHGDIECSFTDILRANDFATQQGLTTTTHTEYNLESSDFARVRCVSDSGKRWSSVLAGVRHDQDVLDQTGWQLPPKEGLPLNVLMFGFDSLSRNSFIRKLPKSYKYLKDQLNPVVLEGYNIVGDGTPQALIPMLTGKTELELPDTRRRMGNKAVHVDVYPFIWNDFREKGYVTAFMEDTPSAGIFTYRLKGFKNVPTDHYMRTFYLEIEPDLGSHKKYCLGSLPRHKVMLDYAKHMYRVYKDRPKWIFGFHGELSHDSYNLVGAADEDLQEWLAWFKDSGHLNNTILLLMSDHGHRFAQVRNTQQGKLEERLPWFSLILPPWFEARHPKAWANLQKNSKRLSTPFDIHATLASILNFRDGQGSLSHRSISLFQEIPAERTCADAYIEPHWCACLDWTPIEPSESTVQKAAKAFVSFLNDYNAGYSDQCAEMEVSSVMWAARLVPSSALRRFHSSADADGFVPKMSKEQVVSMITYQLKLATNPGKALFEVSLTHYVNRDSFKFRIEDVSRINQYGTQAHCIEHSQHQLRKFCYCKDLL